jgi:hypothetical protein
MEVDFVGCVSTIGDVFGSGSCSTVGDNICSLPAYKIKKS